MTYLEPESNGLIDLEKLKAAMRDDTVLVSIMHVNNEIGVIQDIAAIGELCRERKIVFHVDAAQSAGKLPIDVQEMKVDLISLSAHKIYGQKVSVHFTYVVNLVSALKHKCTVAAMSVVSVLVR